MEKYFPTAILHLSQKDTFEKNINKNKKDYQEAFCGENIATSYNHFSKVIS